MKVLIYIATILIFLGLINLMFMLPSPFLYIIGGASLAYLVSSRQKPAEGK